MQILILTEPLANGRFRARAGEPFGLSAEGPTATEATQLLTGLMTERFRNGAQLSLIDLPNQEPRAANPPPLPADELYKTDWVYRELVEAMADQRRLDEVPGS